MHGNRPARCGNQLQYLSLKLYDGCTPFFPLRYRSVRGSVHQTTVFWTPASFPLAAPRSRVLLVQ